LIYREAERLYLKALKLDPNDVTHTLNFAEFLGAAGRFDEARERISRAWELLAKEPSSNTAVATFTRWLFDRASAQDGLPALARLKKILQTGFTRGTWTFDHLLPGLLPQCPENECALAEKLADAILNETKVGALENEPLWQAVEPIPLDVPWPD
jgi:tetratricopeptide (TPR) repeat protein